MANVDNPHGLRPIMRTLSGGPVATQVLSKAVGSGTAIRIWDVVKRLNDGTIVVNTAGVTASGVSLSPGAASTATDHIVIISPDAIFDAQDNADTNGFDSADAGLNCDLEYNAGNASTLISGHELDESTIDTTNTLDVKLLQLVTAPDNEYGGWGRWEVMFNKHRMYPGTAGV